MYTAIKKRLVGKLQDKLCGLITTVAQQLQHSHLTEIGYLNKTLESTNQQLANFKQKLSLANFEEIVYQEKELKGLIQEYRSTNQKMTHFVNQLFSSSEGKTGSFFLKQSWNSLKQYYSQQEEKEGQLVSKYKEFKRRVNNLQKQ